MEESFLGKIYLSELVGGGAVSFHGDENDADQDRGIVRCGPGQDVAVPNGPPEFKPFHHEEERTYRIDGATHSQQDQRRQRRRAA